MPNWLKKKDEKYWEKAKKIVKDKKDKSEDEFKDKDWGLTVHIMQNMKPKKKKKKKADYIPLSHIGMQKIAVSVVIAPYEPVVQKAIELIEKIQPGYFSNVKNIVVEQSPETGDPFHYGKVKSTEPNTIYVNMNAIRSAAAGKNDEASLILAAAGVLAHEMGHLKDKLQGGEGPAENEEHRILNMLSSNSLQETLDALLLTHELELEGFYRSAQVLYAKIENLGTLHKQAIINPYTNPTDVADTILRIVYHFVQKVRPESQQNYIKNFAIKLSKIDELVMANKKKNPGAGIGASISIVKNLISGHTRLEINQILTRVMKGLSNL